MNKDGLADALFEVEILRKSQAKRASAICPYLTRKKSSVFWA